MALNSRNNRASAVAVAVPGARFAPSPDGDISGQADRQHIAGIYRGILASTGPTAPTLLGSSIAANVLYLNFDKLVTFGAGGNSGIALTLSGGACTATYSAGDGTAQLRYGLSRTPASTETGTLAYTQPGNGIEASVGGIDLASIVSQAIEIGSGGRAAFSVNNLFYVRF